MRTVILTLMLLGLLGVAGAVIILVSHRSSWLPYARLIGPLGFALICFAQGARLLLHK